MTSQSNELTKRYQEGIKTLTWDELEDWCGDRVLRRGEAYFKDGHVTDLKICPEGLLAHVTGTELYTTVVKINENGSGLSSWCSCPYGYNCKHAVALILAYSERLRRKEGVPVVDESDPDLLRIKYGPEKDEDDYSFDDDYKMNEPPEEPPQEEVFKYLKSHTKKELIELIT